MSKIKASRRLAAVTASAGAILGVVAVSPASAYSVHNVRDYNTTIEGGNGVRFRTAPGYSTTVRGLVASGDKIRVTATNPGGFGNCEWYKVTLRSKSRNGLPAGTTGWVNWTFVRTLVDKGTQGC
ncbi:SH3 domain-containing protein [Streptomyces sp. NPDC005195]|uniref:SH3 domain-containing protein n=1 Tax=Streptomyces sp. NPDC005195 TaxID=3154561 RepID=UPI0033A2A78B